MPALVAHFEAQIEIPLLGGLYLVRDTLAINQNSSAAFIETVLGVDQFAVILEEPRDAVVWAAAFLVGCERNDDIAIRFVTLAPVADEVGDPDGCLRFVVAGAAAVEVAVLFGEGEGVKAPVFPLGFDDVDVREQENWLQLAGAVIADDEIGLGGDGAAEEEIGLGETGGAKALRDSFCNGSGGSGGVTGFDFDDLLINTAS